MNPNPEENLVNAAADLGRRDTERALTAHDLDEQTSLLVSKIRTDENVVITDLERHLDSPRRPRGTAAIHDPADFALYVKRIAPADTTTVWADIDKGTVTALLDDHDKEGFGAGWRSHTVRLDLQSDPDWDAWVKYDDKMVSQAFFAEFLEQQKHSITQPAAADIVEVAMTLQAKRTVAFASGTRMKNGDYQIKYEEQTDAKAGQKGQVEIPDDFTLRLAPFAYTAPVELVANLRYRIEDGTLRLGYKLIRPQEIRRDAFSAIVGGIRGELGEALPVFLGSVPRLT